MLYNFINTFKATGDVGNVKASICFEKEHGLFFTTCINELGGKSFNHGLYRVYRSDQINTATYLVEEAFPELKNRIVCFAFDWLGRHFAVDSSRQKNGQHLILFIEPGTGEVLQIPSNIIDFHNIELVNYTNDALALSFYNEWKRRNNEVLQHDQCVGYKVPLFLGGDDTIDNLEVIDLEVYIEICGKIRNKIISLPDGTPIRKITIS